MGAVAGVARFVYDFIFGDDWSVALVVVIGLAGTAWLVSNAISAWWLVPLLAIAITGVSLRRARLRRMRTGSGAQIVVAVKSRLEAKTDDRERHRAGRQQVHGR